MDTKKLINYRAFITNQFKITIRYHKYLLPSLIAIAIVLLFWPLFILLKLFNQCRIPFVIIKILNVLLIFYDPIQLCIFALAFTIGVFNEELSYGIMEYLLVLTRIPITKLIPLRSLLFALISMMVFSAVITIQGAFIAQLLGVHYFLELIPYIFMSLIVTFLLSFSSIYALSLAMMVIPQKYKFIYSNIIPLALILPFSIALTSLSHSDIDPSKCLAILVGASLILCLISHSLSVKLRDRIIVNIISYSG